MSFVCLTANPAIDRRLWLNRSLKPGNLNRVAKVHESAGGKGMNVARTLTALGAQPVSTGFLAGLNGTRFRALLQAEGLTGKFITIAGETRECQIVIDGSSQPTEINDPGPHVTSADWQRLLAELPPGQLLISGSMPPGISDVQFGEMIHEVIRLRGEAPTVDTSGSYLAAAIEAGAALVKPNERELLAISPAGLDALSAAKELHERTGVEVLLTLGSAGAAFFGDDAVQVSAPKLTTANPVASGDCLLAAFVWARARGGDTREALRLGVAAGAENANVGGGAKVTEAGIAAMLTRVPPAAPIRPSSSR
jgi:1-phosphofructokinase family hexose kinase